MRWKWIVTIGVLVIVILIATVYVVLKTYDYNKLNPLVARMVEEATGRKLSLEGKVNLEIGLMPTLVATNIALANVSWGSQPQMIEIEKLQAQVRLLPLLHKDVEVNQIGLFGVKVLLETDANGQENWNFLAADSDAGSPGARKPVEIDVERVTIENLHLTFNRQKTDSQTQFTLESLAMNRQETEDALALKLQADVDGQAVMLSGKTGGVHQLLAHKRFPLQLSGSLANAAIDINGAVDDLLNLQGIELAAQLIGKNVATLAPYLNIRLPKTKAFEVNGVLRGSKESLMLENVNGNLSGSSFDLAVSGSISDVIAISGVDLKLISSGKDLAEIGQIIGEKLPITDGFTVQGRLTGSAQVLSLSEAKGTARHGDLSLVCDGGIKDFLNFSEIDLTVKGSGKDLSDIGSIIGEKIPVTDEFAVQGRLTGSPKALSLQDTRGNARRGSMHIAVNGTVEDLLNLRGMNLQSRLTGKNLKEFGDIIGEKLPTTDEFEIQGRLTGSPKVLSMQNARGSARRGGMHIAVNGAVKDLLTLSGMNLQSRLTGKNLEEFGGIIGEKLPATDEFEVQGRLTGSAKTLSLQEAGGRANRGSLRLALKGKIKDVNDLNGIDLRLQGSGKDLAEIGTITGKKFPASDKFTVQGRLMGSTKALSLLEAAGSASRGSLNLTVNGAIKELLALEGINIKLKASGKELADIGPLFGADVDVPELGSFDVSGRLSGSARTITLKDLSAMVDKSDFTGQAKVAFRKRAQINLRLQSSVIDFTALMKSLEKDEEKTTKKEKQNHRLFSDEPLPFDALKKVDADIRIEARNIHIKDARLKFGLLSLKLDDGALRITKLEATYKDAIISGNFQLDSGSSTRLATRFLVQNLDLGGLFRESGINDRIQATVDFAAHLNGRGNSVRSLVANMDGEIGAVMGEGYLTKYLDLISFNLSQKVIHFWGRSKDIDQIKCAVVQFDIKSGVAASQAFVFDTRAGILTGEGEINLGTEKVDFLLVPKPKHPGLIEFSTKLRVRGTILDAKVSPAKLALVETGVRALGSLVTGPLRLLTPFVHLGAHEKHPCEIQSIGQLGLQRP
jgi:uncharacterized protein involved in outer membrane biogenesis